MPAKDQPLPRKTALGVHNIQRGIQLVLAALIIVTLLFAGYYISDRYIHLGDDSPIEVETQQMEQDIRENPSDANARIVLAEGYYRQGKNQMAMDQINQVLTAYPEHEGALLLSGLTNIRINNLEAAVERLEQYVDLRNDRPMAGVDTSLETAYYFLGESYVKLGQSGEAIPHLEAAIAISPTDADALYQAGLAYQDSGQPETALKYYEQAVRFVPDFTEVYSGMIASYTELDKPDFVAFSRGMEAFSLQDYKTAHTHLEYASEAMPDYAPVFLGLGLVNEKLGDLDGAQTALQRALQLNPNDRAAQHALGRVQSALNSQVQL